MSHHPTLHRTSRYGCWCTCTCGWSSELYKRTTGAHLAFGAHLVASKAH